jgi:hypothetical protein
MRDEGNHSGRGLDDLLGRVASMVVWKKPPEEKAQHPSAEYNNECNYAVQSDCHSISPWPACERRPANAGQGRGSALRTQ